MVLLAVVSGMGVLADEGMWLMNQPPRQLLRERYGFEATEAWLEHAQKASARVGGGGSGSFVSEDGLLISNHHVGSHDIYKLSTTNHNYLRDGFYARTQAGELRCHALEVNVLESIEDVTERVTAAVPKGADAADAFAARRKVIAEIEKESLDKTGLRSDVVTLWKGGAYHLYRYKRYTDVRLVFAPEQQIAFFGGDADNFEFPRHNLDICLFRVYENGKPAKVSHFFKFSQSGPRENELVFVTGHPGRTSRLLTMAELEALRDYTVPFNLEWLNRSEVTLLSWSSRSAENARRARDPLFGVQNSRKAWLGRLGGLLDPALMDGKRQAEQAFKIRLAEKPELSDALKAYDRIAAAVSAATPPERIRAALLETGRGFTSDSFSIARRLLRAAEEQAKPNGERLREYTQSSKASLELGLFSEAPIYPDLEKIRLADSLTFMVARLGVEDPLMKRVLGGKSPHARARELVEGTRVREVAFRRQLYQGGSAALAETKDPMIELARIVDAESRRLRKAEDERNEQLEQAHAELARARIAVFGQSGYPDATSTLRLSYGTVKPYVEDGKTVPAFTTFAELYGRAREMEERPPFDLPPLWKSRKSKVDGRTPFNFASTCDIIGGNSGSPVLNRAGEFVGIIFDGNLASLPWDYAFSDTVGRAVSVDSRSILEALNKMYRAGRLLKELQDGKVSP